MLKIIKENKLFLYAFMLFWIAGGIILLLFSKQEIHLFCNSQHNLYFDFIFKYITHLGDGWIPVILFILLLFFSYRKAFIMGVANAFSGLLAQFFKRIVFHETPRPKRFFENIAEIYFVPGVDVHLHHSFPSGHSTSIFCVAFILAWYTNNNILKVVYLFIAVIVGYSRIYLSQHFFIDVYFGAILGIISSLIIIWLIANAKKKWLDNSFIKQKV